MIKKVASITLFALLLFAVAGAQQQAAAADAPTYEVLYAPDMVDATFAMALEEGVEAQALPEAIGFWSDMVDAENTANTGAGVYVAVLDTGLLPEWPFFLSQANVAWELGKGFSHDIVWDAAAGDIAIGPLRDDRGFITDLASGHGTHVASTVVGFNVNNSFWVNGVAPQATIIPVLVLDAWSVPSPFGNINLSGGTDEMVSAGIIYVADLAETLDGPVVINMSLGGPTRSAMIEAAVDYAISKGVIVVASAGNSGIDGMGYPGGLPQIISAAAAGWTDMLNNGWTGDVPEAFNTPDSLGNNWQLFLAPFSSRPVKELGQKHQDLDVAAPGVYVVGPYKSAFLNNTSYYYLSGTSMAAPHVSAAAAAVLETHPTVDQAGMEFILKRAANGLPLPADDALYTAFGGVGLATWDGGDYGAGFLQQDAAVNAADIFDR